LLSKDVSWDENEQFYDEMEPKSALLARLPLAIHAVEYWSHARVVVFFNNEGELSVLMHFTVGSVWRVACI
jgi:hypothetical protein